jgi:hypothetical protein
MPKDKLSGVYLLKNKDTGWIYVGSSENIEYRFKTHFRDLKYNRHCNSRLQEDYNKGYEIEKIIYKTFPLSDHKLLFSEEGKAIRHFQGQGISLYNAMPVNEDFMTSDRLIHLMADLFCMEKYGKNYFQLTGLFVPAQYSLYYETLQNPENEKEIEKRYEPIIQYQTRQRYIKCHYGVKI